MAYADFVTAMMALFMVLWISAQDEGVLEELQAYNPMVPEAGQLCATMFIELTS
ncbi:MAG: hypothetical protein RLZZ516_1132, partial [Cyanobacteriota bacterium]